VKRYFSLYTLLIVLPINQLLADDLQVRITDNNNEPVKDAVIEIISPSIPVPDDWDYMGLIDQIDKEFINNVVPIVQGSYVKFPNSDNIQHHVYSFSENNTFELPLYSATDAEPVLFESPGVTVVGCNIHDWMLGYIYVGESHLMALSGEDGIARINNLPEGNYTFKLWHERARRNDQFSTHEVTITGASSGAGTPQYEISLNLARDRRIRRAPTGTDASYH
jgi:hypothetical protein